MRSEHRSSWPARLEPVQRANLPASIAERLRRQIGQGQLKPGQQLPGHRELAAMFSVSVGSVREAISMLVSEGLVATRAGRGTFVSEGPELLPDAWAILPLDLEKVEELIEAREVMEGQLVAWAAERATKEEIDRLKEIVGRLQSGVNDPHAFIEADIELHLAVAEAAGNRFLLRTMTSIRSLLKRDLELSAEVGARRNGNLQFAVDAHLRLVEAIERRDAAAARAAISGIIDENRAFVIGMYSRSQSGGEDN
ncbi:MAG: FadR family transcriptional regulator [Actinomycetota bacterium]|nr:FadR family transcriptional regulator [Actinomycetota bacterium]